MSSNNKLHAIYRALESQQYSRAIKLCLSHPAATVGGAGSSSSSNNTASTHQQHQSLMVKALLAHAYAKSQQRYKVLLTLQDILGDEYFPELQLEIQYSLERRQEHSNHNNNTTASSSNISGTTLTTTNTPSAAFSSSSSLVAVMGGQQAPMAVTPPTSSTLATNKKTSKKGNKKKVSATSTTTAITTDTTTTTRSSISTITNDNHTDMTTTTLGVLPVDWDWIDQLDTPPTLPENWDRLPPPDHALIDETLLSTLSMTMLAHVRLPLTVYQLFCWAASRTGEQDEYIIRTAYLSGFHVLVSSSYQSIASSILANMQVLALQLARIQQSTMGISPAAAWAAQTALWQLEQLSKNQTTTSSSTNTNDQAIVPINTSQQHAKHLALLPRLAESLAYKCIQQSMANGGDTIPPRDSLVITEEFLLYLRTLEIQAKHTELYTALEGRMQQYAIDGDYQQQQQQQMSPPRSTLQNMQINVLQKLGRYTEARQIIENILILEQPDDWSYWKKHLDCVMMETSVDDNTDCIQQGFSLTENFIQRVLDQLESQQQQKEDNKTSYPIRGPHLMRVEIELHRHKKILSSDSLHSLMDSIIVYGDLYASVVACIFMDLRPYMEYVLKNCTLEQVSILLDWSKRLRIEPSSTNPRQRQNELLQYIFSVQVNYQILAQYPTLINETTLVSWLELVHVWYTFQSFEQLDSNNVDPIDKERKDCRPGDDLILLAIQPLLYNSPTKNDILTAACLLEAAIRYSPHNAFLKLEAIQVFGTLHATSRCWDLFKQIFIKHIQHESCSYVILPILRSGGFYRETISVCQEILRLQKNAVREAGEYAGRAMENGSFSKAEEFVHFHREKMNASLTTIEAKGLTLDAAPMFVQDERQDVLGALHGIVGAETDIERASQMVAEAYNPSAAFSLLRLEKAMGENGKTLSDNRDFGIFAHEILYIRQFDSPERIVQDSLRRGHFHSLLIRATLCVEAIKSPKKGKLGKVQPEQEKRCRSLLSCLRMGANATDSLSQTRGYATFQNCMYEMCQVIAVLGAGVYLDSAPLNDTLESRETRGAQFLRRAVVSLDEGRATLAIGASDEYFPVVSQLMMDCLVPVYALVKMCARIADIFGWGKRKQKPKQFSLAMAEMARGLSSLICDMKDCLTSLPDSSLGVSHSERLLTMKDLLGSSIVDETCLAILSSQEQSRKRIEAIVSMMKDYLDSFETTDQANGLDVL